MNDTLVEEKIKSICENINRDGLYRYDPRDIDDFVGNIHHTTFRKLANILLQLGEVIHPYFIRKLLSAKKRVFPTTYTFLAESQYCEQDSLPILDGQELMEECLKRYYQKDGFWPFKANHTFFPMQSEEAPSMPLYMLCRCNNLLIRMGTALHKEDWVQIAKQSAEYVLTHHSITHYSDGTESIGYYYNSDEFTINVNAELIDWLSQLTVYTAESSYILHIEKILLAILREQDVDGAWNYFGRGTMKKYALPSVIDCHHTATTLYNLIHVYERGYFLSPELKLRLKRSILRGMQYFTEHFFDKKNGNGIVIVGKKRKASTVQYAESLVSLLEFLRVFQGEVVKEASSYQKLAHLLCLRLVQHVCTDGSSPGDMKLKKINLNNINWGNGPALMALCMYRRSECI